MYAFFVPAPLTQTPTQVAMAKIRTRLLPESACPTHITY